jgi:hypothetical protein
MWRTASTQTVRALCVGVQTNQLSKENSVNYYEELAKLSVAELEAELRSLRSTADALPEVKGNPTPALRIEAIAAVRGLTNATYCSKISALNRSMEIQPAMRRPRNEQPISKVRS